MGRVWSLSSWTSWHQLTRFNWNFDLGRNVVYQFIELWHEHRAPVYRNVMCSGHKLIEVLCEPDNTCHMKYLVESWPFQNSNLPSTEKNRLTLWPYRKCTMLYPMLYWFMCTCGLFSMHNVVSNVVLIHVYMWVILSEIWLFVTFKLVCNLCVTRLRIISSKFLLKGSHLWFHRSSSSIVEVMLKTSFTFYFVITMIKH